MLSLALCCCLINCCAALFYASLCVNFSLLISCECRNETDGKAQDVRRGRGCDIGMGRGRASESGAATTAM